MELEYRRWIKFVLVMKSKTAGQTSDKTREKVKKLIDPTEIEVSG